MNTPVATLAALAALVLTGCVSKNLPQALSDTGSFATDVALSYRQDLLTLKHAEQTRREELVRMQGEIVTLQNQIVGILVQDFDRRREAAVARVEAKYDREAQQLLAEDFWRRLRELRAAGGAQQEVDVAFQRMLAGLAEAGQAPKDGAAESRALLATRRFLALNSLDFQFAQEQFDRLARRLKEERGTFLSAARQAIMAVKFEPKQRTFDPAGAAAGTSFEQDIDRRRKEIERAAQVLKTSFDTMSRALDTSGSAAAIAEGFFGGLTKTSNVADLLKTILDTAKIEPLGKGSSATVGSAATALTEAATDLQDKTKAVEDTADAEAAKVVAKVKETLSILAPQTPAKPADDGKAPKP